MSWHNNTCSGLELHWQNGLPECRKCGSSSAHVITEQSESSPPSPPLLLKRSDLNMTWPPGIAYEPVDPSSSILKDIDQWDVCPRRKSPVPIIAAIEHPKQPSVGQKSSGSIDSSNPVGRNATIYETLPKQNTIRLLCLHGSDSATSPIHCSLEAHQLGLADAPLYEALSYTWADENGDKRLRCPIFIGPQYHVLLTTNSCSSALRRFRTRHDRLLWVDAICINQDNVEERDYQVSLMRKIYSSAGRVLIYLGPATEDTDEAMRLVNSSVAPYHASSGENATALQALVDLPYFRRTWIIQEAALAKEATITCGDKTGHWSSFCAALRTSKLHEVEDNMAAWVVTLSASEKSEPDTLTRLCKDTAHCQAGDPRDRIFALMGLISDKEAALLPVDYSLSAQQVFTGISAYWTVQGEATHLLACIFTDNRTSGLPSWVPDWSDQGSEARDADGSLAPNVRPSSAYLALYPSCTESFWYKHLQAAISTRWYSGVSEYDPTDPVAYTTRFDTNGGLETEAYHVFHYRGGEMHPLDCIWCPSDSAHLISWAVSEALAGTTSGSQETYKVFWVPLFRKLMRVKQQGAGVFSIYDTLNLDREWARWQGHGKLIQWWISTTILLGMRSAASVQRLPGEVPCSDEARLGIWFPRPGHEDILFKIWLGTAVMWFGVGGYKIPKVGTPCDVEQFESMTRLRARILDILSPEELNRLRDLDKKGARKFNTLLPNSSKVLRFLVPRKLALPRYVDTMFFRIFDNDIIKAEWNEDRVDLDQDLREWEAGYSTLSQRFLKLGPLSTAMEVAGPTWYHMGFETVKPLLAVWESGCGGVPEPMRGHVMHSDAESEDTWISMAGLVLWAWEVADRTHLDAGMPLEWNRHQFWICFTSLVFVVQLREVLVSIQCEDYVQTRMGDEKVEKIRIV